MSFEKGARVGRAASLLIALVHVYRWTLACWLGGQCRFVPSCSVFAQQALGRHGAWRGVMLTVRRLGRCHPWHGSGGIDPVPERLSGGRVGSKQ